MKEKQIVAAFDFDGTLSYKDTLFPYLCYVNGLWKTLVSYLFLTHYLLGYCFNYFSRKDLKEKLIYLTLSKYPIGYIQEKSRQFAEEKLPKHLRKDGLKKLNWHLKEGHLCILISANLDLYLHPWALKAGFHHVVTSECEVNKGFLTGKLKGNNCRGHEKVKRLNSLLGEEKKYTLYAYGDSKGDKELLAFSDYPHYKPFR